MSETDMKPFFEIFHRGLTKSDIAEAIVDHEIENNLVNNTLKDLMMFGHYGYFNYDDYSLKRQYDEYFPEEHNE